MDAMPYKIKQKIRKIAKLYNDARTEGILLDEMMNQYGIDTSNLTMTGTGDVQTEGLAFIFNVEGDLEDNIEEIENVFLYYVNQNNNLENK